MFLHFIWDTSLSVVERENGRKEMSFFMVVEQNNVAKKCPTCIAMTTTNSFASAYSWPVMDVRSVCGIGGAIGCHSHKR